MKIILTAAVAILMSLSSVQAHNFKELKIANTTMFDQFFMIYLQDTVKDHEIVCAVYSQDGSLVASTTAFTETLATEAIIMSQALMKFSSASNLTAKCVFSD